MGENCKDGHCGTDHECGCGSGSCGCSSERKFHTKEEKLVMLKEYKDELQKEIKGVEEKIKELDAK